jgi:anti-anti-sigma factor
VVREQGTTTTIELQGECDLAGLQSMRHAISRVVEAVPECVVLDLSGLDYIDSCGLHATVELTRRSAAQNTRLVIIPGPRTVQWVFEVTGLLERLPFIDERSNASLASGIGAAPTARAHWHAAVEPRTGGGPS